MRIASGPSYDLAAAHAFPLRHEEHTERPTVPGEPVGDRGVGRLAELDTPGREAPGRHRSHRLIVY